LCVGRNAGAERDDDDEAEDAPPRPEGDRPYPDESFRARMMRMFEPYRLENQALWVEDRRPVSLDLGGGLTGD